MGCLLACLGAAELLLVTSAQIHLWDSVTLAARPLAAGEIGSRAAIASLAERLTFDSEAPEVRLTSGPMIVVEASVAVGAVTLLGRAGPFASRRLSAVAVRLRETGQ